MCLVQFLPYSYKDIQSRMICKCAFWGVRALPGCSSPNSSLPQQSSIHQILPVPCERGFCALRVRCSMMLMSSGGSFVCAYANNDFLIYSGDVCRHTHAHLQHHPGTHTHVLSHTWTTFCSRCRGVFTHVCARCECLRIYYTHCVCVCVCAISGWGG